MGPLGLRQRLVLFVLLPLSAFSGVLGFIALKQFEAVLRARMEFDVRLVTRAFQPVLAQIVNEDMSRDSLQPLLRRAFEEEGDYGIFVYDLQGTMVARAGNFEGTETDPPDMSLADDPGESLRGGVYSEAAGEAVYSYFAPLITENGEIMGILQVARIRKDYDQFLAGLRLGALAFLITGTLIVVGVVAMGYQQAIGASLEDLNASMLRVKQGDRSHRATPNGPVEVAGLAQTLNEMLTSIENAEREIISQEEKERHLLERLKQSEKLASLGNISAGVAHELGTPLSVIVMNAQRALRQKSNPEKTVDALWGIRAEVERMDRIVRQLLDYGRAGGYEARPVSPETLARSALNAVEPVRRERGGSLEVGQTFEGGLLKVNPVRVELALINLLKNALEASGGGCVRFSWSATPAGACFEVADDGPGVDAETADKIFEPFFSTKGADHGVGLGLAIVVQVADESNGLVRVVSNPGEGARFHLTIPFDGKKS